MQNVKLKCICSSFLFASILSGCSSSGIEEIDLPPEPDIPIVEAESTIEQLEINLTPMTADSQAETRTEALVDANGATFVWSEDDVIGIFSDYSDQVRFPLKSGGGQATATFSGGGWGLRRGYSYAAYYPYDSENSNRIDGTILIDYGTQQQTGNASLADVGRCDFMATGVTMPAEGRLSFEFEHLGCMVQLKLTLPSATNPLTKLTLKSGKQCIPVKQSLNLVNYGMSSPSTIEMSSELSMMLSDIEATDTQKVLTFYMMLPPMSLFTDNVSLVARLTDGVNGYEGRLTSAGLDEGKVKDLVAGKIYALSATLEDSSISGSSSISNFDNNQW